MDIWLDPTLKNAEQVVKALHQFGFGALELTRKIF
jgi:hypothetical protein